MFAEALAYTIRFKQTVFRLVGKGRSRIKPFSREFKKWGIRVFMLLIEYEDLLMGVNFPILVVFNKKIKLYYICPFFLKKKIIIKMLLLFFEQIDNLN
jgi:hypothetical protein